MAIDKAIDSAKEAACRTAEANAIRAKTGSTAQITYDFDNGKGFADAIDSIPAGGSAPSLQSKSVTYTANGTNTITPDEGYDGLSSVDVTVDVVADVPLVTVTFKATQLGDEISSPGEEASVEMQRIVISA